MDIEGRPGLDEDWELVLTLLPREWQTQAVLQGASERLRGFDSVGALLRTLLLHVGKGYSLRETAVRAKAAGLAQVSDVALLHRLRKAEGWLRWLCGQLVAESEWELPADTRGRNVRALDGTLVKEPGQRGDQWRIHYSLQIPSLVCDHVEITSTQGTGVAETLARFAARPGDLVLADRGFCKAPGIFALHSQGGDIIIRVNTASLSLWERGGKRFPLLGRLRSLPGFTAGEWPVAVRSAGQQLQGRICAVRKSEQARLQAERKIRRKAQQGGPKTKPETLELAGYVIVFTTLPGSEFDCPAVLEWYRARWQIELVFKRLKSLAKLGHLPKHDPQNARSWLYGKLLLALLGQKLRRLGRDISPWGYRLPEAWRWQRMAGL
jgi:hypothetical protein